MSCEHTTPTSTVSRYDAMVFIEIQVSDNSPIFTLLSARFQTPPNPEGNIWPAKCFTTDSTEQ